MASISIGNRSRPLEGLSVGQTLKIWIARGTLPSPPAARREGQRRLDTAASHKAFRGKKSLKAKGSGWIWINNYPMPSTT